MLDWSRQYFEDNHIDNPQLDSQILLGHVLGMTKVQLIINGMRPLDENELAAYKKLVIKRVKEHQPIAYIIGHRDFWSLDLNVNENVLIPRPDTECLVEQALAWIQHRLDNKPLPWPSSDNTEYSYDDLDSRQVYYEEISQSESLEQKTENWLNSQANRFSSLDSDEARQAYENDVLKSKTEPDEQSKHIDSACKKLHIADIGTGSGAIILALASELRDKCEYSAVDISKAALDVARQNAEKLSLNIQFLESDLCQNLPESLDVIVSNPPYISDGEMTELSPEVRKEPELALRAGVDGLDVYKKLVPQAFKKLNPGGTLFVEIGSKQSESVEQIFQKTGFVNIRTFKDYGRRPRIVFGLKP